MKRRTRRSKRRRSSRSTRCRKKEGHFICGTLCSASALLSCSREYETNWISLRRHFLIKKLVVGIARMKRASIGANCKGSRTFLSLCLSVSQYLSLRANRTPKAMAWVFFPLLPFFLSQITLFYFASRRSSRFFDCDAELRLPMSRKTRHALDAGRKRSKIKRREGWTRGGKRWLTFFLVSMQATRAKDG